MTGFRLAAVLVAIPAMLAGVWPAPVSARARSAQQAAPAPPAAAPANQPPVFKAGVELVRLDVRVVDDKGLPIKDLKPEEVTVTEGGEPRPVVLFQHIAEPAGTYLEAARRTIGAEVSTNQGAPRGHLYLFVFDQNHITPGNEVSARARRSSGSSERASSPATASRSTRCPGPGPQLPLSSNVNLALAELPKVRGMLEREGMAIGAMMTDFEAYQIVRGDPNYLQRFLNRVASNLSAGGDVTGVATTGAVAATDTASETVRVAKENARTIVRARGERDPGLPGDLRDVIRELAKIEGRKTVILVSEGFFTDRLRVDIDKVAAAAAEAYAVIYSLDVNRRDIDFNAAEPVGATASAEIQSRLDSLDTLALETSGEVRARRRQPHGGGAQPDRQRLAGLLHRRLRAAAERTCRPPRLPPRAGLGHAARRAGRVAHRLRASRAGDAGRPAAGDRRRARRSVPAAGPAARDDDLRARGATAPARSAC